MADALDCLNELRKINRNFQLPVRVWGDSQLLIKHLIGVFKKPSKTRVYEAVAKAKSYKR